MYIKKFGTFIVEKYEGVIINGGDNDKASNEDHKKLDIINKYFPFAEISGKSDWQPGIINLSFDEGRFTIKGEYNDNESIMPSILTINDSGESYNYKFNWHSYNAGGGTNFEDFENEIKNIYENYNTFSLVVANENYGVFNIGEFKTEEEALNKLKECSIILERGKHVEGKLLNNFKIVHKF